MFVTPQPPGKISHMHGALYTPAPPHEARSCKVYKSPVNSPLQHNLVRVVQAPSRSSFTATSYSPQPTMPRKSVHASAAVLLALATLMCVLQLAAARLGSVDGIVGSLKSWARQHGHDQIEEEPSEPIRGRTGTGAALSTCASWSGLE